MTILYDRDGRHYKKGAGLSVYETNGRQMVKPSELGRKTIPIPAPVASSAKSAPIDLAVNYVKKGFPFLPHQSTIIPRI